MNKKIILLIIIALILIGLGVCYFFFYNLGEQTRVEEIIPEEEIS